MDADGDGVLDALTANSQSDTVSVWSNLSGTPVETAVSLPASDRAPVALAVGDFDGDSAADDIVLACSDSDSVATVLDLGAAIPSFSSLYAEGTRPVAIAAGDLDGDGTDDVVVGREGAPISGGQGIAVSLGNTPFVEVAIPAGHSNQIVEVSVCDLDGDANLDLAAVARGAIDQILLFVGDGAGGLTFADAIALASSGVASGINCHDIDGDGDLDFAVLLPRFPASGSDLQWFAFAANGPLDASDYTASALIATSGELALDLEFADVDADSIPGWLARPDCVVVHAGSNDVALFSGLDPSNSTFASSAPLAAGTGPVAAAVADLNGDCALDIVIANQGSDDISVHMGQPQALAQPFGDGCSGTGGLVPILAASGLPVLGNASFGLALTQGRPLAPTLFLWSFAPTQPAVSGCSLLMASPFASQLRFTDGNGSDTWSFEIPNDPVLLCFELYFQVAVFDSQGTFGGFAAMSGGLRGRVGL